MRSGKPTNNYGYTLMELIMAMAIIFIASSLAIPSYNRYLEITQENVCVINMKTILYEYQLFSITEPKVTFPEYIKIYYPEYESHLCPSGGIYTAGGSGDTAELTCSVHCDLISQTDDLFLPEQPSEP